MKDYNVYILGRRIVVMVKTKKSDKSSDKNYTTISVIPEVKRRFKKYSTKDENASDTINNLLNIAARPRAVIVDVTTVDDSLADLHITSIREHKKITNIIQNLDYEIAYTMIQVMDEILKLFSVGFDFDGDWQFKKYIEVDVE